MSVSLQCPTLNVAGMTYAHEWTTDSGAHHVALHSSLLTAALVVSDADEALALADVLQDAARRLRLHELSVLRREAVSA